MRGPALVGYEPAQVRWSGDSRQVYFQWKTAAQKEDAPADTYVVNRDGTGLRKLSDDEAKLAPPVNGDLSDDRRAIVYTSAGDLFVYDNPTGKTRQITKTGDAESNPKFLADGKRISFTRACNLYVLSLEDGTLTQMTDIRSDAAPGRRGPAVDGGGRGGRGGGGPRQRPPPDSPRAAPTARSGSRRNRRSCSRSSASAPPCAKRPRPAARRRTLASPSPSPRASPSPPSSSRPTRRPSSRPSSRPLPAPGTPSFPTTSPNRPTPRTSPAAPTSATPSRACASP